jgi:hypothetical protein
MSHSTDARTEASVADHNPVSNEVGGERAGVVLRGRDLHRFRARLGRYPGTAVVTAPTRRAATRRELERVIAAMKRS